jgi:elongation factor 1-alpha
MEEFIRKIGGWSINTCNIPFVPVSAWHNENILSRSTNMEWYTGPTLKEALNTVTVPPRPEDLLVLRVPIQSFFHKPNVGTVVMGRVEYTSYRNRI